MVGKSTCGNGATGKNGYDTAPTISTPTISSEVAIGRCMNGVEIAITASSLARGRGNIGVYATSGLQAVLTRDHDWDRRPQAGSDHGCPLGHLIDLDRLHRDRHVRLDHINV